MIDDEKEMFFTCLDAALQVKGKSLTPPVFELWWEILEPFGLDDIKKAIKQSLSQTNFALDPAKILEQLPDLLGHPTPEIAWNLFPKYESDAGYVTDEIMKAGSVIEDTSDRMARMAFLEAYKQILANAKMNGDKAKWFYSHTADGTREQRKEAKIQHTIEAMQCGRLTSEKAENTVKLLCNELDKPLKHYLPNLIEPPETMKLEDQREQIGTISNKISKALNQTLDPSSSTSEEERKARVDKIQADLDRYNKEGKERDEKAKLIGQH